MRCAVLVLLFAWEADMCGAQSSLVPQIIGESWTIAGDPDLGGLTSPKQEPVDFAVWQAADGTWQLWSCIRNTKCGGRTRLFYRWQSQHLTDPNWRPVGIAMQADPNLGETPGGLQAPHVAKIGKLFHMFYGDWENICVATSEDGKAFTRRIDASRRTGMFTEGPGANTRDPMVIRIAGRWHCYYTAFPNQKGAVYCRTSEDTRIWSPSKIVAFGGRAGAGPTSAECPHVVCLGPRSYYLFRTQRYGTDACTAVYCSSDPMDFGVDDDSHFVCTLPVAAPEIIIHDGAYYIASLLPNLKGIRIARLQWGPPRTRNDAAR